MTSPPRGRTWEPGSRSAPRRAPRRFRERKSTRLNSSHLVISYAVFCLKKKKQHGHRVAVGAEDDEHRADRDRGEELVSRHDYATHLHKHPRAGDEERLD